MQTRTLKRLINQRADNLRSLFLIRLSERLLEAKKEVAASYKILIDLEQATILYVKYKRLCQKLKRDIHYEIIESSSNTDQLFIYYTNLMNKYKKMREQHLSFSNK